MLIDKCKHLVLLRNLFPLEIKVFGLRVPNLCQELPTHGIFKTTLLGEIAVTVCTRHQRHTKWQN